MFIATSRRVVKIAPDAAMQRWLRLLDQSEGGFEQAFLSGVESMTRGYNASAVAAAYRVNAAAVEAALPWDEFARSFQRGLNTAMPGALDRGAMLAITRMQVPHSFWTVTDPHVATWLRNHSANLVQQVSNETRRAIRQHVARAYLEGKPPGAAAKGIRDVIGLTRRQEMAVANFRTGLKSAIAEGRSAASIRSQWGLSRGIVRGDKVLQAKNVDRLTKAYRNRMISHRAGVIARHESALAASEGKWHAFKQARASGALPPTARMEWIVTPDERTCEICLPNHGTQVRLGEAFPSGDTRPPAHVMCRCDVRMIRFPKRRKGNRYRTRTNRRVREIGAQRAGRRAAREGRPVWSEADAAATHSRVARIAEERRARLAAEQGVTPDYYEPPEATAAGVGESVSIDWAGEGMTDEFRRTVQGTLDEMPESIKTALARGEQKIRVGRRLADIELHLAANKPRGWAKGSTWEMAEGYYQPSTKTVNLFEQKLSAVTQTYETGTRTPGVLRHEIGHAVDTLHPESHFSSFSHQPRFKEIHAKIISRMNSIQKRELAYFIQADSAGLEEAFAEAFGHALGGGSADGYTSRLFRQTFGRLIRYVETEVLTTL